MKKGKIIISEKLPMIPLRGLVVFPTITTSLYIGRKSSLDSLMNAKDQDAKVVLAVQKDKKTDRPGLNDIYDVATVASVIKFRHMPDGTVRALVEGERRCEVVSVNQKEGAGYECEIAELKEIKPSKRRQETMCKTLMENLKQYFEIRERADEIANIMSIQQSLSRCIDTVASIFPLKLEDSQKILALRNVESRFNHIMDYIKSELEIATMDNRIQQRVREQIDKSHKEYYLNEQVKAIRRELGGGDEKNEIEELEERAKKKTFSKEAAEKFASEIRKLKTMSPMAAEATVTRNYLEWMLDLPWGKQTKSKDINIARAEKILDREHYGLKEIKERILEYLALYRKVEKGKAPLILLVGPPGVGKTSLGNAIAKATGRKLVRFSLGGVHDEAEIRGHRRTYIGSMPGKIIQKIAKAKVDNPLLLLDEVDKISSDFRGDPSSALLEALDPEQNHTFNDHYLEVDYDLSNVMFVCTANTLRIPPALLDRMEIIRIPGYTDVDKISIAKRHLIPKQLELSGLKKRDISFTTKVLHQIIDNHTREAGVRELERQLSKIMRKSVLLESRDSKALPLQLSESNLSDFLGVDKYSYTKLPNKRTNVGQVSGLAWTRVGGDILTIEASLLPGNGKLIRTGHLGEVMQESIQAAISIIRSRHRALGMPRDFYQKCDYHIHVPEGATPKDGPSAGMAMCIALISCLINEPVRGDVAMTGEITLRGDVLKIGGLKEKLLAAQRSKIKKVIIPYENEKELKEMDDAVLKKLDIIPVRTLDEALGVAFKKLPDNFDMEKFSAITSLDLATEPRVSPH